MGKDINSQFTGGKKQSYKEHSNSLLMKETQIKPTLRYPPSPPQFKPIRLAKDSKVLNDECWRCRHPRALLLRGNQWLWTARLSASSVHPLTLNSSSIWHQAKELSSSKSKFLSREDAWRDWERRGTWSSTEIIAMADMERDRQGGRFHPSEK